ncbi:MAG: heterodisulfide reductase-related iron-sulfur binding cluster [Desulfosoma sp.]|uniref:heterodisulfide reductase-related iron-sulfur binding cluster n=1 Tax=Desulfosoma sp. TaxID=2603217 RepID=UPI00404B20DF
MPSSRQSTAAATTARHPLQRLFDGCTDCDICRFLMDESCLLFPEMYRLYDEAVAQKRSPSLEVLKDLADRCTLCGLCPCPDVRSNVILAKAMRTQRQGLDPGARLLSDLQTFARLGQKVPRVANALSSVPAVRHLLEKIFQLHPQRQLPRLAKEDFFSWAVKEGLQRKGPPPQGGVRIAYFVGCTAAYLFPQVARAVVQVFRAAGAHIEVPPQQCCGMPTVVEGDMARSVERITANMNTLLHAVSEGYHVVCSCPTCGYFMRNLLKENACLATGCLETALEAGVAKRATAGVPSHEVTIPSGPPKRPSAQTYGPSALADDAFLNLSPSKRLQLSQHLWDVGEYLDRLRQQYGWRPRWHPSKGRWVYYAPCHQREQGFGTPYFDLLQEIPGLQLKRVGSSTDCCGMGGSLGYKKAFHEKSLQLGASLMEKITKEDPQAIVTDCLSCRLQFQYALGLPVYHPIEVMGQALVPAS